MYDDLATPTGNPDRLRDGPDSDAPLYGEQDAEPGALLRMPREDAAEWVAKKWNSRSEAMRRSLVLWEVNRLRRAGFRNVRAKYVDGRWARWMPKSASADGPDALPTPNVVADIDRKFVAFLCSDPPAPDVLPPSGDDDDVEASQTATRILEDAQGEAGLRTTQKLRRALDKACDHGSGFEYLYVEPRRQRVPVRIKSGFAPEQKDAQGQIVAPMARATHVGAEGDPGDSLLNPATGMAWPSWERRWVRPDGTLTDKEHEAAQTWGPKLLSRVYTGRNLRLFPHTATDVWEATGFVLTDYLTWGECKRRWPEIRQLDEETQSEIRSYRGIKDIEHVRGDSLARKDTESHEDRDETLIVWQAYYHQDSEEYPGGCHVEALGGKYAVIQEPWQRTVEGRDVALELPISQYAMFAEGSDDLYRTGLSQLVGSLSELDAAVWSIVLTHLDRVASRKTFLPLGSNVKAHQLANRGLTYIPITEGGEPKYEDVPNLPPEIAELLATVKDAINNASGLQQTAQGLESADVKSGRHAYAIIGQVYGAISEVVQNTENGYIRSSRIAMQLLATHFADEQVVAYKDNGQHRTDYWRGSDLASMRDIAVRPGTMTMQTPAAKEMQARDYHTMNLFSPYEFKDIIRRNAGARIGLEEDRHLLRARGQIADYLKGPPDGWQPPEPQPETQYVQTPQGLEARTINRAPAPDPYVGALWEGILADDMPAVAEMRMQELAKTMAGKRHLSFHPVWRAGLETEFKRAAQAVRAAADPPQQTQKPSESITFKDLPPDGQAQMAAQVGIRLDAGQLAAAQAQDAAQELATKQPTQPRPETEGAAYQREHGTPPGMGGLPPQIARQVAQDAAVTGVARL